jgi:hypothetical protein
VLIARVWVNGHAYSISGYTFPLHDDATRHFAKTRTAGPISTTNAPMDQCNEHTEQLTFRQSAFIVVQSTYITVYRADL